MALDVLFDNHRIRRRRPGKKRAENHYSGSTDCPCSYTKHDSQFRKIYFGCQAQIGILAYAAIAAAGRLAADSANESNANPVANTRPYDGILGRAILAENTLQCFFELSSSQQESFSSFLGPVVAALNPFVLKISPKLLKGILEPSMRLPLANMKSGLGTSNKRNTRSDAAETDTGFGRKLI